MSWPVIISGNLLILLVLSWVLFRKINWINRQDEQKKSIQEYNDILHELAEESTRLEKTVRENFQRIRRYNSEMGSIINDLSWKEKSIKRSLENIRVEINNPENTAANNPTKNPVSDKQKSFEDILNQTLEIPDDGNIPEKYLQIFKLYELGMTADEIAEEMDIGVRETELIFKLYGKGIDNAVR